MSGCVRAIRRFRFRNVEEQGAYPGVEASQQHKETKAEQTSSMVAQRTSQQSTHVIGEGRLGAVLALRIVRQHNLEPNAEHALLHHDMPRRLVDEDLREFRE